VTVSNLIWPSQFEPKLWFRNAATNRCADIPGGELGDANVNQFDCHGGQNQSFYENWIWVWEPSLNAFSVHSQLINMLTGKCLQATGSGVVQRACSSNFNQLWRYLDNTAPAPAGFVLKNRGTGQCARSSSAGSGNGLQIGMTSCPATSGAATAAVTWQRPTGLVACFP
jgi:hypothetical protein